MRIMASTMLQMTGDFINERWCHRWRHKWYMTSQMTDYVTAVVKDDRWRQKCQMVSRGRWRHRWNERWRHRWHDVMWQVSRKIFTLQAQFVDLFVSVETFTHSIGSATVGWTDWGQMWVKLIGILARVEIYFKCLLKKHPSWHMASFEGHSAQNSAVGTPKVSHPRM